MLCDICSIITLATIILCQHKWTSRPVRCETLQRMHLWIVCTSLSTVCKTWEVLSLPGIMWEWIWLHWRHSIILICSCTSHLAPLYHGDCETEDKIFLFTPFNANPEYTFFLGMVTAKPTLNILIFHSINFLLHIIHKYICIV